MCVKNRCLETAVVDAPAKKGALSSHETPLSILLFSQYCVSISVSVLSTSVVNTIRIQVTSETARLYTLYQMPIGTTEQREAVAALSSNLCFEKYTMSI